MTLSQSGVSGEHTLVRYGTVVADPPWEYAEGFPQGPAHGRGRSTVSLPYGAMTLDQIATIPVDQLAAPDAWLFLWATNKHLPNAFRLIRDWGFGYRQTITWRKTGCPSPFVRSLAPAHSEFLLVARRGKPRRLGSFPSSVIEAPAQSRHSAKPDLFLDIIERVAPGPYAELFARRARLGWSYPIGDQALGGRAA